MTAFEIGAINRNGRGFTGKDLAKYRKQCGEFFRATRKQTAQKNYGLINWGGIGMKPATLSPGYRSAQAVKQQNKN